MLCKCVLLVLLCLPALHVLGARSVGLQNAGTEIFTSREAARIRREAMHSHISPVLPSDDTDDLDDDHSFEEIKGMLLEAHAFDQHRLQRELGLGKKGKPEPEPGPEPDTEFCYKKKYRKATLKAIREAPFIGLFNDLLNITRFEGSSITFAKGAYWVVFDSLRAIGKVGIQFQFRGPENKLIPEDAGEAESQFEGMQYMAATDTFLAVRESTNHEEHGLIPLTEEIAINKDESSWTLKSVCPVLFDGLEDSNKGWEGLHYYEKDGERFLMGLCESNYCKTIQGRDPPGLDRGNGRVILTKLRTGKSNKAGHDEDCHWEVVKEIKLPREAFFLDYAGIAFFPDPFGARVAVVSQEDAAVWLGHFDWDKLEFVPGGKVYHFPRNDRCEKIFCNVEGLTWLDHQRFMFASDKSKSTQGFSCMGRDQSVHIMALP